MELALKYYLAVAATMFFLCSAVASPQDTAAGEQRYRELYKELVETNTSLSAGSCTLAAERMAARLKAAGFRTATCTPLPRPTTPRKAAWSRCTRDGTRS